MLFDYNITEKLEKLMKNICFCCELLLYPLILRHIIKTAGHPLPERLSGCFYPCPINRDDQSVRFRLAEHLLTAFVALDW
ncbi:hypothetical protein TcarDRAFT_1400 [Thermosinus carboxydivorans Nor1]|uniref:Uncharacterized protein n=1 Tax=Thermosinus carboxydivorans Nor1 TaxID=401526 RepID=A1HRN6_9FIRM|nr:hypothetical protein TcarDRAFT_1400 [Thermosinus carboxydivorans Nor1]